jgi:hypothetical protein
LRCAADESRISQGYHSVLKSHGFIIRCDIVTRAWRWRWRLWRWEKRDGMGCRLKDEYVESGIRYACAQSRMMSRVFSDFLMNAHDDGFVSMLRQWNGEVKGGF